MFVVYVYKTSVTYFPKNIFKQRLLSPQDNLTDFGLLVEYYLVRNTQPSNVSHKSLCPQISQPEWMLSKKRT